MVEDKVFSRYMPNDTPKIRKRMMKEIGIKSEEELFSDIDENLQLKKPLNIPGPFSELEVRKEVERILKKNRSAKDLICFLGAGIWPHYVPAAVDEIASRSEFLTSYTPYQPEISQGLLQALFEYQSMICELLEMDVANCSMYDWSSALGEAARMTARVTGRNTFLVPYYIKPSRLSVLQNYAKPAGIKILTFHQNPDNGQIDLEDLKHKVSSRDVAGAYIENPSYLGFIIENPEEISGIVHDAGGLLVAGVDPTSLGVLKPPGDYEADIAIGEGQPLGNYMNGGGSLLGIFACRDDNLLIRQMPGRIVGMTTTIDGRDRAFCLALQTREQHIRRHRATSNICTNEALGALRAAVYMALLGPEGFKELGEAILSRTAYMINELSKIRGLKVPLFKAYHFKEFTVNFDETGFSVQELSKKLLEHGIVGGKPLNEEFPELGQTSLYCVTEIHSKEDIDRFCSILKIIVEGA
ncbi:aminomethyl-transferring glycine dehydrogenase subunit GcvPA [Candidatus Bathyarchaeota archaeon]|nr:aminomethyl-transferring glycine dehydrogenase subunit GcvPA [Candidatus Bathyarchaeota archaeon]